MPDRQREMVIEVPLPDFSRGPFDRLCELAFQRTQALVCPRRRQLLHAKGTDETGGEAFLADIEDAECPLGLGAPIPIRGHLDRAERIVLDTLGGAGKAGRLSPSCCTAISLADAQPLRKWCLRRSIAATEKIDEFPRSHPKQREFAVWPQIATGMLQPTFIDRVVPVLP